MRKAYQIGIALILTAGAVGAAVAQRANTPAAPAAPAQIVPASAARFDGLMGGTVDLTQYRGQVVLVVNTASRCGLTGQYAGLEALWRQRRAQGLVIVGVPSNDFAGQEPGSAAEIAKFCELNYGVTFPMTAKYAVTGNQAHPFYRNAAQALGQAGIPRWNFHKILIGRDGRPVAGFGSRVNPDARELTTAIDAALARRT